MKLECFWGEGLGMRVRWWCIEAWEGGVRLVVTRRCRVAESLEGEEQRGRRVTLLAAVVECE